MTRLTLNIAGASHEVTADPGTRLSEVLREELGITSVKSGCDAGDCGACTVLMDGAQQCSCLVPVIQAEGARIETVDHAEPDLALALQEAFLNHGAAQCGICTPGMMMAATQLLREVSSPSQTQVEDALGGVLCRCTGYSKIIQAVMSLGRVTSCPAPVVGQAVGAGIARVDGQPKVDGSEVFGADFTPDAALSVRAIRSPHFHATFTLGDVAAWQKATTGVVAILTAADVPEENRFGTIPIFADQPALADGVARMRGEAAALVVGEPEEVEALDVSDFPVTWTPLDHALTEAETVADIHPDRPENTLIRGRVACGDAAATLRASSAHVAHARVQTAYVEHAYIEPEAGSAWMDGDVLVIQACTQAPVMDQEETARVLGLPKERVRIIPAAAGGGFGGKLDLSVQPLLGLAVLKTGRPAKMVWSRRDSMQASTKRHPATMEAEIGADAEGRITAMRFHGEFNTGPYSSWGPTVAVRVPVHASGPYRTPNYHATSRAVHTNGPNAGAFRGFGVPQAAICQEMIYDELAASCGMDRLAFRRLNVLRDGDKTTCGQVLASVGMEECLDALAAPWEAALAEAERVNAQGGVIRRGVGVASCWYGCGNTSLPNPSTVRIGITPKGRVVLHQGATDIGQGANTVITQIAADALGVWVDVIDRVGPDTALTPDCGKTSASRQTYVTGRAAEAAGRALRARILAMTNLGEGAELTLGDGTLHVAEGEALRAIDLGALPRDEFGYVLRAEESYDPPTAPLDENGQGIPYAVYGYGAQIAEVEVDMALGTVKVRRMTAAHDLGRVINPVLAEGQIEGGIAQGLGMALMEEYVPGRTENLHDYLIPTVGDMPEIRTIFVEKPDPEGPMGARGLGEHALIPTAPAILNAIRHASGARIAKLPALPHRVLAAIRAAHGA